MRPNPPALSANNIVRLDPDELPTEPQPADVADVVARRITNRLRPAPVDGSPAAAVTRIFGRLTELMANRLDQVPDKHFLAFLDRAGINLLAAKPATVDLTFVLGEDGPGVVQVPAGTQVATLATETKPEVVFETDETLTVVANEIQRCIAFDQRDFADRTALVTDIKSQPFLPFRGQSEDDFPSRQRVLYLAAEKLFDFEDDASREAATISFHFTLAEVDEDDDLIPDSDRNQGDGEKENKKDGEEERKQVGLHVRFWDGETWQAFEKAQVDEQDEAVAGESEVQNEVEEQREADVQDKSAKKGKFDDHTDGLARSGAVVLTELPPMVVTESDGFLFSIDADFYQAEPPDRRQRALLEMLERAFDKHHMKLWGKNSIDFAPANVDPESGEPTEFLLKNCHDPESMKPGPAASAAAPPEDTQCFTYRVVRNESLFDVFADFAKAPLRWIEFSLPDDESCLPDERTRCHEVKIRGVRAERSIKIGGPKETKGDEATAALQGNSAFAAIDPADEFFPFGQQPAQLDTFYLRSDQAFSKPGALVTIRVSGLTGISGTAAGGDPSGMAATGNSQSEPTSEIVEPNGLADLKIVWEYHSASGWQQLGTSTRDGPESAKGLDFEDETNAFTANGEEGPLKIQFVVPDGKPKTRFQKTVVDEVDGYWIRARIASGSYTVPAEVEVLDKNKGSYKFHPAKSYAPLVKEWKLSFGGYEEGPIGYPITLCHSSVDTMLRDHRPALLDGKRFTPFLARTEGPAFYIGLRNAFPAGTWIQLLLDAREQQSENGDDVTALFWEYWNGDGWNRLRVVDHSHNMMVRGFLQFTAPSDHRRSTEFGSTAFWIRARPHVELPEAMATAEQQWPAVKVRIRATGEEGYAVTLDGAGSHSQPGTRIDRYRWRHVSEKISASDGVQVIARDMPDRPHADAPQVSLQDDGAKWEARFKPPTLNAALTIEIDRTTTEGAHYIWRKAPDPAPTGDKHRLAPQLNAIWLNTVSAVNAITVVDEVLGSSDSNPAQVFQLAGAPVHEAIELVVREPDRPPESELQALQNELREREPQAVAIEEEPGDAGGRHPWVRWHVVESFRYSGKDSRHFMLDPIGGRVIFGDGQRGKIPPVGRDNIVARKYRIHNGHDGIFAANNVTVLRNPSDDLADVRSVTNPEPSVGGSDAETVEGVKQRGPQMLRHRHQAVTEGGFSWLAREATSQVARAQAIAHTNRHGMADPGWMTVVIVPNLPDDEAPMPSPVLIRHVRAYLDQHASMSITQPEGRQASHIYVKGPEYISISAMVRVFAASGWNPDSVKAGILNRLATFLNPLNGGPDRTGWQFGRDVYLSEIIAEIEAEMGVDYAYDVRLKGTISQRSITVNVNGPIEHPIPRGSIVATFDSRMRMILADPVGDEDRGEVEGEDEDGDVAYPLTLTAHGFNTDDSVSLVASDDSIVFGDLISVDVDGSDKTAPGRFVVLRVGPEWTGDVKCSDLLCKLDGLMAQDGRVRLPLHEDWLKDLTHLSADRERLIRVCVKELDPGTTIDVLTDGRRDPLLSALPVKAIETPTDRIIVPANHLVRKGVLDVEVRAGYR